MQIWPGQEFLEILFAIWGLGISKRIARDLGAGIGLLWASQIAENFGFHPPGGAPSEVKVVGSSVCCAVGAAARHAHRPVLVRLALSRLPACNS